MSESRLGEDISRRGNGGVRSDYSGSQETLYVDSQMQVMSSNCGGYMVHVRNLGNGEIHIPRKKLEEIATSDMDKGLRIFEGLCQVMGRRHENISGEHVVGALTKMYFSKVLRMTDRQTSLDSAD